MGHKNGIAIKCQCIHVYSSFLLFSAEIEAIEACKWLRAAGFPQYAQMYEGKLEHRQKSGGSWPCVRDQRMKRRMRGEFYIRNPFDYDSVYSQSQMQKTRTSSCELKRFQQIKRIHRVFFIIGTLLENVCDIEISKFQF